MKIGPFTELAESLNEQDANAAFIIKYKREIVTFNFDANKVLELCDVILKFEPAFLDQLTNFVIDKHNEKCVTKQEHC